MSEVGIVGLLVVLWVGDNIWIAATALRLGIPLVSNDGIFEVNPRPRAPDRLMHADATGVRHP